MSAKLEPAPGAAPSKTMPTILLVDDKDDSRVTTKWFLSNFGYEVDTARTAEEALLLFNPKIHDLVITDNSMPGMTGAEMALVIKMRAPSTPVIMFTGGPPNDVSQLDMVIQRPTPLLRLKDAVQSVLSKKVAEPENDGEKNGAG